jgi:bifunctional DNase/RNase
MLIKMQIKGLMIDPITNMPIVILKDTKTNSVLPIWVGIFEANAIMLKIENIETPRPMTHDLIKSILANLKAKVEKIVVTTLKNNTYYALIFLNVDGKKIEVDSRPSDAIALALRTESPIYVEESVIEQARNFDLSSDISDSEKIKKWFENLDPQDFSKYKM